MGEPLKPRKYHPRRSAWSIGIAQENNIRKEWGGPNEWSGDDLLYCRTDHISHWASEVLEDNIQSCGAIGKMMKVLGRLDRLGRPASQIIREAGFSHLLRALKSMREPTSHCLVRALLERFWDTSNTFHFPTCEMTITPYDFTMITGLPFGIHPLEYSETLEEDLDARIELFGPVMQNITSKRSFRYSIFFEEVEQDRFWGADYTDDQRKRVLLALLIGTTILADQGNRIYFHYLENLANLDRVRDLAWGAAAYSCLIRGLRSGVRVPRSNDNKSNSYVPCLWKVIEIWFYEYFEELSPKSTAPKLFPVARRWTNRHLLEKRRKAGNLAYFRSMLNQLGRGATDPWTAYTVTVAEFPCLDIAQELTCLRVLFEGPFTYTWYCGERVTHQWSNVWPPYVPVNPPKKMFYPRSLTHNERDLGFAGHPVAGLLNYNQNYVDFILPRLMGPLHTGTPTVPNPLGLRRRKRKRYPGLPLAANSRGFTREQTIEAMQLLYDYYDLLQDTRRRLRQRMGYAPRRGGKDHRRNRGNRDGGKHNYHSNNHDDNDNHDHDDHDDDDDDDNDGNNDTQREEWRGTQGRFGAGSSGGGHDEFHTARACTNSSIPDIPEDIMENSSNSSDSDIFTLVRGSRRTRTYGRYISEDDTSHSHDETGISQLEHEFGNLSITEGCSEYSHDDCSNPSYHTSKDFKENSHENCSSHSYHASKDFKEAPHDILVLIMPTLGTPKFFTSTTSYFLCKEKEQGKKKYGPEWTLATGVSARVLRGYNPDAYHVDELGIVYTNELSSRHPTVKSSSDEQNQVSNSHSIVFDDKYHPIGECTSPRVTGRRFGFSGPEVIDLISDEDD